MFFFFFYDKCTYGVYMLRLLPIFIYELLLSKGKRLLSLKAVIRDLGLTIEPRPSLLKYKCIT